MLIYFDNIVRLQDYHSLACSAAQHSKLPVDRSHVT